MVFVASIYIPIGDVEDGQPGDGGGDGLPVWRP